MKTFLFIYPYYFTVQYLIQKGVVAIVGPMTSTGVKFTQPYCAGFHIPQLAPVATDPTFSFTPANFPFLVRLSPSDTIQCQALAGLITHYNWTQIALLTSKDDYGLWLFLSLSSFLLFVYNARQVFLFHNSGPWGVKSTLYQTSTVGTSTNSPSSRCACFRKVKKG